MATATSALSRIRRSDLPLVGVSVAILMLYVYYALTFTFSTPYPGFTFTGTNGGWQVTDSFQADLEVGDLLTQIGNLVYGDYQSDRRSVPFAGYVPGDQVSNVVLADGTDLTLTMPVPTTADRLRRLFPTLWFFPFWVAGTVVLLFLQPRDQRWRLLVAFMYLTAVWWLVGAVSAWRIGGSRILLGAVIWLMMPVYLHLHLTVPTELFPRMTRILVPPLYVAALILAFLEGTQSVPNALPYAGLLFAIGGSCLLIAYRIARKDSLPSEKIAARLMLAGIGLGFGPGLITIILPSLVSAPTANILGLGISLIAIPLMPFFYTYALYKRQLGAIEFRVSRLLSLYSFILIYLTAFIAVLLFGEQRIESGGARTIYLLIASMIFVLATPTLMARFQRALSRLAYGTEHDPDDILRIFAKQIPTALRRDTLVRLLTQEITPTLLIRQSALYLFEDGQPAPLYQDNIPLSGRLSDYQLAKPLLSYVGRYIVPDSDELGQLSWVRLIVSLVTRNEIIGVWLFGRRDPDDFYPRNDIELLEALANQIAPVIENIRLYEALMYQADQLAEEVARRTEELRAERDRTQAILDSAGEGIFFTDPRGVILYSNQAMAALSGYDAEELIGKSLDLWQTETDTGEGYRQMWTAIYDGREWGGELLLRRQDGSYRDIRLKIAPILSQDGALSGYVGVQSDITRLKEVDRLKSTIISSVSHELKTPLTTIKTYLMLLQRGRKEKREAYLNVVNREADRLTNIIEDLLDLSALDTGKIPSRFAPTNVQTVVEETLVSCSARALAKGIELQSDLSQDLPPVLADSNQLEQVLSNLVVNAINYTPPKGQVKVSAGQESVDGETAIWLRVADSGPGIAPEELPHLFERFYRGKAARDSNAPGTGLGLTICREIINRHNGRIDVDSKPGQGATFTIWLRPSEQRLAVP
ncbi:MAG: ATP-binding protein [Candidatus Promineifilaceae bacterium]